MSRIERAINSCGVVQYEGMNNYSPHSIITDVCNNYRNFNCAFLTFSNPVSCGNIKELGKYITSEGLGKTTYIEGLNPNSGNNIGYLIWHYSIDLVEKYIKSKKDLFPNFVFYKEGKLVKVIRNSNSSGAYVG